MRPTIVSISGLSSNVGKTTLMCELLQRFRGWEAIKISRGHYRSCGKDPKACCISPLLGERPQIFSGEHETCVQGKDTGRYWEAGAANVHWLICTNEQLEEGSQAALSGVRSTGVFIEGTSFLKFIPADYSIMVVRHNLDEIKSTALRVADKISAFYLSDSLGDEKMFAAIQNRYARRNVRLAEKPVYFQDQVDRLAEAIKLASVAPEGTARVTADFIQIVR
jgi:molybdopterin-guanine dinucleotide biosynthesis protein